MNKPTDRQTAIDAWYVLNDLLSDLLIASRSFDILDQPPVLAIMSRDLAAGFRRMFYFHLFLSLTKCAEFYDRFRRALPDDVTAAWRSFRTWAEDSRLRDFRNKYVGHIWDKDANRPLRREELLAYFEKIVGPDREAFLRWINDRASNVFPSTVVSILEHTRNRIQAIHALSPPDILPLHSDA